MTTEEPLRSLPARPSRAAAVLADMKPEGDVYLGEDAYRLLRLYCPFCGSPVRERCAHRLAVLDDAWFQHVDPLFAKHLERFAGLTEEDGSVDEDFLMPARLTSRYPRSEDLVRAAAADINARLPDGNGVVVFLVRNPRRYDRRCVVYAAENALEFLRRTVGA